MEQAALACGAITYQSEKGLFKTNYNFNFNIIFNHNRKSVFRKSGKCGKLCGKAGDISPPPRRTTIR